MEKVLIIEDDQILRDNIVILFNEEGFDVYQATNGVDGLHLAMDIMPDLIICDISMPRMTGYDVIRSLQALPATATIPFVFLTAKIQHDDIRLGMNLGASDYITKPFDIHDLLLSAKARIKKNKDIRSITEHNMKAMAQCTIVGAFVYQHNQFTFVNDRFVQLSAYTKDDIKPKKIDDLFLDETKEKLLACIHSCIDSFSLKGFFIKHDQSTIAVELFIALIKTGVNETCLLGNIQEIKQNMLPIPPEVMINNAKKFQISKRELDVLQLLTQGLSSKQIADKLFISQRTVETHRANIMHKTNTVNTADLIRFSIAHHFVIQ